METPEEKTEEKKEPPKKVLIRDVSDTASAKDLRFTKRVYMTYEDEDGVKHEGEFTLTRPNLRGQARIGVIMAEMREDKPPSSLDRPTFQLHDWLATLLVVVTASPPWWKPEEMFDPQPLLELYEVAQTWLATFRKGRVG